MLDHSLLGRDPSTGMGKFLEERLEFRGRDQDKRRHNRWIKRLSQEVVRF